MPRLTALLSVTLLAAACSSTATTTTTPFAPPPATSAPVTTTPVSTTTTSPATTTVPSPTEGFTLADHLSWLLGLLNGAEATEGAYEARFADEFKAQVPFDAFATPLGQFAGEWTVGEQNFSADGRTGEVLLETADGPALVGVLAIDPDRDGRLVGLLFRPAQLDDPPQSLDELTEQWGELAPRAGLAAIDVTDGEAGCASGDDRQFAVGSVFKLWVLHALAAAVEDGTAAWDEVLPVSDGLKSLPSGTMQDEPAGTEFTLAQHAELMISISDNTATDHLIDRLGRNTVEAALAATGHAEPGHNRPFLTTRELFWLKLLAPRDVVDAYIAGDEEGRRAILAGADIDLTAVDVADLEAFTSPQDIDTLEWFASVADVCRVLVALHGTFAGSPATDALTVNPGARIDPADWPSVGFKGGSEPGVLALAWHAERSDGRAFVVAGMLNDTQRPVDEITAVLLAERAFELLAGSP